MHFLTDRILGYFPITTMRRVFRVHGPALGVNHKILVKLGTAYNLLEYKRYKKRETHEMIEIFYLFRLPDWSSALTKPEQSLLTSSKHVLTNISAIN